jgi:hypothetical protein
MSGQSSSSADKKTQSRIAARLQATLQRIPLMSHIVMLILALYGPTQFQYQVAFVFFTLHIVLVSSQFRTAYGVIRSVATFLFFPNPVVRLLPAFPTERAQLIPPMPFCSSLQMSKLYSRTFAN